MIWIAITPHLCKFCKCGFRLFAKLNLGFSNSLAHKVSQSFRISAAFANTVLQVSQRHCREFVDVSQTQFCKFWLFATMFRKVLLFKFSSLAEPVGFESLFLKDL